MWILCLSLSALHDMWVCWLCARLDTLSFFESCSCLSRGCMRLVCACDSECYAHLCATLLFASLLPIFFRSFDTKFSVGKSTNKSKCITLPLARARVYTCNFGTKTEILSLSLYLPSRHALSVCLLSFVHWQWDIECANWTKENS